MSKIFKMRGVAELLRLYNRSKSNSDKVVNVASEPNALAAARPRIGINGWPMVQLAGVRFLRAANSCSGMGKDEKPTPSPTPSPAPAPKPPSPRPPSRQSGRFPKWTKFVLGSVFSLLLALWTPKWATLLKIGGEAEIAMKEVEQVAEVVEKVATVVEKVSEEVADNLPDDNKIKEAALIVEHVSKEAAKDAHIAEEIIRKIDVVKHDLDDVGEIVKPIIEEIAHDNKSRKADDDS